MTPNGHRWTDDSGHVPIFEWSGWRFDSSSEIFSLLDGKD